MLPDLYIKKKKLTKIAGYSLSKNPDQWQHEILNYLMSTHPYIKPQDVDIRFAKVDPSTNSALGAIILNNKATVPIIIEADKKTKAPQLAPFDVFFSDGKFIPMSEKALASSQFVPEVGEIDQNQGRLDSGNPYIGDVTGDISPLEYSPGGANSGSVLKQSHFEWLRSIDIEDIEKTAHDSWTGDVGVNPNDLDHFQKIISKNMDLFVASGNNSDLIHVAMNKTPRSTIEYIPTKPQLVQIYKAPRGDDYFVKFQDGPAFKSTWSELKSMFYSNWDRISSQLKTNGSYTAAINLDLKSYPASFSDAKHSGNKIAKSITGYGTHQVCTPAGTSLGHVMPMVNLDGSNAKQKMFIEAVTHNFAISSQMFGGQLADVEDKLAGESPRPGMTCCIVCGYKHMNMASTPFMVLKISSVGNETGYLVQDFISGHRKTLVVIPHFEGFERAEDTGPSLMLGDDVKTIYYIPGSSRFVKLAKNIKVITASEEITKIASYGPKFSIYRSPDGSLFDIHGKTANMVDIGYMHLDHITAKAKLIGHGFIPHEADKALSKTAGNVRTYTNVGPSQFKSLDKKAVMYTIDINKVDRIKPSEDLLIKTAEVGNREALDTVLSLQFVTPQNIGWFVEAIPDMKTTLTKLAALLVASRIGLETIDQKNVKTAMSGLDKTINDLELLARANETN